MPGEQRDHLGLARVPGAARRHVEVRRARREEHGEGTRGPHPQRPRGRRDGADRGRGREGAVPARRSPTRTNEAGRIIEEARQSAEQVRRDLIAAGRGRGDRDPRHGPRPTSPTSAAGDGRAARPTSPQLSIELAESIVEHNLDRDTQPPARRQLHRPGREQLADGRPHRGVRAGAARDRRRPRATSTRSRTSCSASRGSSRATTSCAWRSPNPGLPVDRRAAIVEELLENRALPTTRGDRGVHRRRRSRPRPAGDRRPRSSSSRPQTREHEVAEVRSAVPLDDAQQAAARRRAVAGDRQAGRGQGRRRPDVLGGIVATIGDTVIDGTVRHRLEQLKETHLDGRADDQRRRHRGGAAQERRGLHARRSSRRRSAACSRSATASRASPACPTPRSTSCSSSRAARSASR